MSVLEKYKLIEKENEQSTFEETLSEPIQTVPTVATNDVPVEDFIPIPTPAASIPMPTPEPVRAIEQAPIEPLIHHHTHTLTLEEIYNLYELQGLAVTDTVFVLENLIYALPAELPEYVKKTTVDNIIKGSAMDLDKLLTDGSKRIHYLDDFINDYANQTTQDIQALKQEITKLSALISDYQEQIKHKNQLLQEQSGLVQQEAIRLTHVLEFFNQ